MPILNMGSGGIDTSDATAKESSILYPETAYVNGVKITGNIPLLQAQTFTPGGSDQVIPAGKYLSGAQTIKGLPTYSAQTITPGTSDIVLAQGRLLSGAQTIKGDANLIPENIKDGSVIFGIAGSAGYRVFSTTFVGNGTNSMQVINADVQSAPFSVNNQALVWFDLDVDPSSPSGFLLLASAWISKDFIGGSSDRQLMLYRITDGMQLGGDTTGSASATIVGTEGSKSMSVGVPWARFSTDGTYTVRIAYKV